jgi:hypothetical protein
VSANSYRAIRTEAFNIWRQETCAQHVARSTQHNRREFRPSDKSYRDNAHSRRSRNLPTKARRHRFLTRGIIALGIMEAA